MTAIFFVGVLSALLVIPQVRAVAGGSSRRRPIIGLVIGFAARTTLGELRRGDPDRVRPAGPARGLGRDRGRGRTVEEIGLTYTFVRTEDNARLVIPNERLASDTIRNTTIVERAAVAEATVQVPLTADLEAVVGLLLQSRFGTSVTDVVVTALEDKATVTCAPGRRRRARCASGSRATCACARTGAAGGRDAGMSPASSRSSASHAVSAPPPAAPLAGRGRQRRLIRRRLPIVASRCWSPRSGSAAQRVPLSCTLDSLRPVRSATTRSCTPPTGRCSASIPAERNRQPVALPLMSPWLKQGDGCDRGPPLLEARRRRLRGHRSRALEGHPGRAGRRGRLHDHAAARAHALHPDARPDVRAASSRRHASRSKLSEAWSKHRILAAYLNHVYYGNHAYGVEAAAQTYFSRRARS